jgi:hypothetical protein
MKGLRKSISLLLFSAIGLIIAGFVRFERMVKRETEALLAVADEAPHNVVRPEMLEKLPEPVQRYLTYARVVHTPMLGSVRLRQTGRIRRDASQPWMPLTAEEVYTTSPPGFVWKARASLNGLPLGLVRDMYHEARGNMLVTAAGLVPLVDAAGPEMDEASLLRYLNEMMWFPAAFVGDNLSWEEVDDNAARVTLTDRGRSVSGVMHFDEEGRLTNFVAERYRDVGDGAFSLEKWSTPITAYGVFNGLRLPAQGQAVWHLASGDLVYAELEIVDIVYNIV